MNFQPSPLRGSKVLDMDESGGFNFSPKEGPRPIHLQPLDSQHQRPGTSPARPVGGSSGLGGEDSLFGPMATHGRTGLYRDPPIRRPQTTPALSTTAIHRGDPRDLSVFSKSALFRTTRESAHFADSVYHALFSLPPNLPNVDAYIENDDLKMRNLKVANWELRLPPHSAEILKEPMASLALKPSFDNIPPGTQTEVGEILFAKLELGGSAEEEKKEPAKANGKEKGGAKGGNQEGKKAKGEGNKGGGGKKKGNAPAVEATSDFPLMDIRVGKITKVWEHPEAQKLWCEEIDVGEDQPRQIASGLREHYTQDQMDGHRVAVVCNLKPAKLAGFPSAGMVLAATGANGKVELVTPPEGAAVGERVYVDGHVGEPATAAQVKKKKLMEKVAEDLRTNSDRIACYKGLPILTSAGPLCVGSVENAKIK